MRFIIILFACIIIAGCAVQTEVTQPDVYPVLKSSSAIYYPGIDLKKKEITVPVMLYINVRGDVSKIELPESTGLSALDDTIKNSLFRWKYYPAESGGKAIGIWISQKITIQFQSLLSYDLSEIVVSSASLADSILQELKKGTDFETLAKEYSLTATAKDGGYIGKVNVGDFRPELWDAISKLKPGEWTIALPIDHQFTIYKRIK